MNLYSHQIQHVVLGVFVSTARVAEEQAGAQATEEDHQDPVPEGGEPGAG